MDDIRLLDDDRPEPRPPALRRWTLVVLTVALAAVVSVVGASLFGSAAPPPSSSDVALKQQPRELMGQAAGCVVRFTTAGPRIHTNMTHECSLGTELRVAPNGRLELLGAPEQPVVTLSCQPDESLVVREIDCGPSGGTGRISYQLTYRGKPIDADSYRLVCTYCNLWLGGIYA